MTIRMLAIDVDGTLVSSEGNVSAYTRDVIHRAVNEGIHAVITTGRSRYFLHRVKEQLELNEPFICNNGAEIWLNNQTLFMRNALTIEKANEIMNVLNEHDVHHIWGNSIEGDFKPSDFEKPIEIAPMKIGAWFHNKETLTAVRKQLGTIKGLSITSSAELNLEVMVAGTTKAEGLKKLAANLDVSMEEIMCFGDSYNDVEMFKHCGVAVAMGNANDEVKQLATHMTATNDEDGVAKAIEKYILDDFK
ncbi:HAD family hydrolase [Kurthia senegalensis]|uniref:HAD family hydrolase n=1 Tax=Kurthia senegalensis TaxID=1033740 RepID=UPI0002887F63|nr:HAD family hydrolase [Kurthia senegalensis]